MGGGGGRWGEGVALSKKDTGVLSGARTPTPFQTRVRTYIPHFRQSIYAHLLSQLTSKVQQESRNIKFN